MILRVQSKALAFDIPEATACNFMREVEKQLSEGKDVEAIDIPLR